MSHFTRVKTQIVDLDCLLDALSDLGYNTVEVGSNLGLYGYQGDLRPERADVVVRREFVGRLSNDIGFFLRSDGTYEAIVSDYDRGRMPRFVQDVSQRYAYHVVKQQAEMQGFTVDSEEIEQDGTIKLVCTQW